MKIAARTKRRGFRCHLFLSAKKIPKDIEIYYKDWGSGQPVVFSHGWPLSAGAFEEQVFYLASRGYRYIAHDRRGLARSSQQWNGNEMDTYAVVGSNALRR